MMTKYEIGDDILVEGEVIGIAVGQDRVVKYKVAIPNEEECENAIWIRQECTLCIGEDI